MNSKNLVDEALENIKKEYGFEEIKNAFDEASVQNNLNFSMVVKMKKACNFLSHNEDNNEFISFLSSENAQNIMTNNSQIWKYFL